MNLKELIETHFPSPVMDNSWPLWSEETELIRRLIDGDELLAGRVSVGQGYAVRFYWGADCGDQYDMPVMRLLGRQVVRPVSCFGGFTRIEITERARELIVALTNTEGTEGQGEG